jgi:hypothetical protein
MCSKGNPNSGDPALNHPNHHSTSPLAQRVIQLETEKGTHQHRLLEQAAIIKDLEARLRALDMENERWERSTKRPTSHTSIESAASSTYSIFPSPRKLKPFNIPELGMKEEKRRRSGSTISCSVFSDEDTALIGCSDRELKAQKRKNRIGRHYAFDL